MVLSILKQQFTEEKLKYWFPLADIGNPQRGLLQNEAWL